ncbi:MAG: HIT family protein [Microgenomates group bacterium GW2011_GWC1_44_9]|nr:MAG: HIT family protein [Microgenomates group bacterium GW2011_GWC1_44_9]
MLDMTERRKWLPDEVLRASGETAPNRYCPSYPARFLVENELVNGRILDFGCGHGFDVEYFLNHGIEAMGWDPVHRPEIPPEMYPQGYFKWIHCAFVLNTLPYSDQRLDILVQIHNLLPNDGRLILTLRSSQELIRKVKPVWKKFGDGYVTSRGTFQKGYTPAEAVELIQPLFAEITIINENPVVIIAKKSDLARG